MTACTCTRVQFGIGKHLTQVVLFGWDVATDIILARVRLCMAGGGTCRVPTGLDATPGPCSKRAHE